MEVDQVHVQASLPSVHWTVGAQSQTCRQPNPEAKDASSSHTLTARRLPGTTAPLQPCAPRLNSSIRDSQQEETSSQTQMSRLESEPSNSDITAPKSDFHLRVRSTRHSSFCFTYVRITFITAVLFLQSFIQMVHLSTSSHIRPHHVTE